MPFLYLGSVTSKSQRGGISTTAPHPPGHRACVSGNEPLSTGEGAQPPIDEWGRGTKATQPFIVHAGARVRTVPLATIWEKLQPGPNVSQAQWANMTGCNRVTGLGEQIEGCFEQGALTKWWWWW